jgi:hypothetical protein
MTNQTSVRITAYIPKDMKEKLAIIAKKRYTDVSSIVKALIISELNKEE